MNGSTSKTMQRVFRRKGSIPHVAIIGAGFAGLRCADVLIQSGAHVTMYEARDRVGGRVHQEKLAGRLMDVGPNWIHGTDNNPICTIASKTMTALHDFDGRMSLFDSNGKSIPSDEARYLFETCWEIIAKAFKHSEENKDHIDPSKSLLDFFKDQVPQLTEDPKRRTQILEMANEWGAYVGDPVDMQSLKHFFLEQCIEGETPFVAGTYSKILEAVAAPALTKADIRFEEKVTLIETSKSSDPETKPIGITSSKSRNLYDEVVVTCPLGYLKKHKSDLFSEPLPPRLNQAVHNISYGRLEKVYITFPTAWWQDATSPQATLPITTPTASTSDIRPSTSPSFLHFSSPTYVPHSPSSPWNQELVLLSTLTTHPQPTLLFYLYGPCSTHLVSLLKPHPPSSPTYTSILTEFFSPYYSRIPNYNPSSPDCTPAGVLATQWQNDDLAGNGSYCNFQVGLEDGSEDIRVMRESEGTGLERGIWFAGEHTSPEVALGTTTGAWWAGEGVGKKVAELWGLSVPEGVEMREEVRKDVKVDGDGAGAAQMMGMGL